MRKGFILSLMAVATLFIGCDKGNDGSSEVKLHDFDAPEFAINLGEDFEEFRTSKAEYVINSKSTDSKFVMGGYVEADGVQYKLEIRVTKNRYGKVESIVAVPVNKKASETLMRYYLNNSEAESLGVWQGANWKTVSNGASSAGIHQTVEQALMQLGAGTAGLTIDAIYSVVSGRAYAVSTIEDGSFRLSLVNSFYRIDFDVLVQLLGSNWSKLQSDNRFTGYKTGFGELFYVWFYYALDLQDNVFNMAAYADEQKLLIKTIRLTMPEDVASDVQLDAWVPYAMGDESLSLGEFQKAYLADSTGAEIEPLASQAAALEHVQENGRPTAFANNVVVEYLKGEVRIVITLDSKYVTIDLFKDADVAK